MPNYEEDYDSSWQNLLEDGSMDLYDESIYDTLMDGSIGEWDSIDYCRFTLAGTAKLSFSVNADGAAKFTIYKLNGSEPDYSLKQLQSTSLKKNKTTKYKDEEGEWIYVVPDYAYSLTTKSLLLEEGEYFISVQTTNKTGDEAWYQVGLDSSSAFFGGKGDTMDDDWKPIAKGPVNDEDYDYFYNYGEYDLGALTVLQDITLFENWVGYGDDTDYRMFSLENVAKLCFSVSADDASKFTVYKLNTDGSKQSLSKIQSTTLSKVTVASGEEDEDRPSYLATPKGLLLEAGTYFVSMVSSNAAKGGNAAYSVNLTAESTFFSDKGDRGDDDWNPIAAKPGEGEDDTEYQEKYGAYDLGTIQDFYHLDVENWVGYGDPVDYRMFSLEGAAKLCLTVNASDLSKFTICKLNPNGSKKPLTQLQSTVLSKTKVTKIKNEDGDWEYIYPEAAYSLTTKTMLLEAGTYIFSMQSTNADKGGNADYHVYADEEKSLFYGNLADNSDDGTRSPNEDGTPGFHVFGQLLPGAANVMNDWVGFGDEYDYMQFTLDGTAKLSFTINASDAVKISICKLNDKDGVYSFSTLQATTATKNKGTWYNDDGEKWFEEPDWNYSATTKPLKLSSGEYYICVQSTNAAKGGYADYFVILDEKSTFEQVNYPVYGPDQKSPDDGWNNWLYNKKVGVNQMLLESDGVICGPGVSEILVDNPIDPEYEDYHNFVGQGDEIDYAKITLQSAAKLSFRIESTDAARFTISRLTTAYDKKGTISYSLQSIQVASLVLNQNTDTFSVTTQSFLLDAGEYYISMQSSNAARGGSAYYNVYLDESSVFFADADDGSNNWLYDKNTKSLNSHLVSGSATVIDPSTNYIQMDRNVVSYNSGYSEYTNFVGFGDRTDYAKIHLDSDGMVSFQIQSTDDAVFSVYSLTNKDGAYTLNTLQTTTLKIEKNSGAYYVSTKKLPLSAGDYYISMESTNAAQGGSAYYNVSLDMNSVFFVDALDGDFGSGYTETSFMSEPDLGGALSDGLEIQDYAGTSAFGLADVRLDDMPISGQGNALLA